jgi:hypothetical protein
VSMPGSIEGRTARRVCTTRDCAWACGEPKNIKPETCPVAQTIATSTILRLTEFLYLPENDATIVPLAVAKRETNSVRIVDLRDASPSHSSRDRARFHKVALDNTPRNAERPRRFAGAVVREFRSSCRLNRQWRYFANPSFRPIASMRSTTRLL